MKLTPERRLSLGAGIRASGAFESAQGNVAQSFWLAA